MKRLKTIACAAICLALLFTLAACGETAYEDVSPQIGNKSVGFSVSESNSAAKSEDTEIYQRQVIRTAHLSAQTKAFDSAAKQLTALVQAHGGYTESCTQRTDDVREVEYTMRVPADELDAFLAEVGDLIHVTYSTIGQDDITVQYYDTQSRIDTLKAEKQALDTMMSNAATTDEMLKIHERLYDVMEELDSLQTRMNVMKDRVSLATVTISLEEVVEYDAASESYGNRAKNAVEESWSNFAAFWVSLSIFLIYALPVLLTVGVIVLVVIIITKKNRRKHATLPPPPNNGNAN